MLLDISESSEVVFKIGWGQNRDYLPIPDVNTGLQAQPRTTQSAALQPFANGMLSVFVVNPITSPSDTPASVQINVFTRACPDFEVAVPKCGALTNIAPIVNPVEPDPEDGEDIIFANARFSTWGNPVDLSRTDPFSTDTFQVVDVTNPSAYSISSFFSEAQTVEGTLTLKNGSGPLGMDILWRGVRYSFNMSADETRSFDYTWPVNEGWNLANFFFDVDQFATDDFQILSLTTAKPAGNLQNIITGGSLAQLMVGNHLVDTYPSSTNEYITHTVLGESLTILLPPETSYGQTVVLTMTTPSAVNGVQFDTFTNNAVPFDSSYVVSASVPLNRRIILSRPTNIPVGDWEPQLNGISFYASPDFVPQGEGGEERNQDSDTANAPEALAPDVTMGPPSDVYGLNDIYFGEGVASWRQMLKRFVTTHEVIGSGTNGLTNVRVALPLYPLEDISSSSPVVIANTTENIFRYVSSAYVCMRGSMRIKLRNSDWGGGLRSWCPHVSRSSQTTYDADATATFPHMTWCGSATDILSAKPYGEFELPVYSNLRFTSPRNLGPHTPNEFIERTIFNATFNNIRTEMVVNVAYASSEDFSLHFFLSTPILVL
jgi:hypothetical protein